MEWEERRTQVGATGASQASLDLGVFQETKVMDGDQTRALSSSCVFTTDVPSRNHGRDSIFYCNSPHFQVEGLQQHRSKLMIFQVSSVG